MSLRDYSAVAIHTLSAPVKQLFEKVRKRGKKEENCKSSSVENRNHGICAQHSINAGDIFDASNCVFARSKDGFYLNEQNVRM